MIYTTLARICKYSPCSSGWKRLTRHLGTDFPMDSPFPMVEILNAEGDGLDDCLWALRAEPQHEKLYRLYAVNRARSVQHLMTDPRSIAAMDVAERYAHGTTTEDELDATRAAAWAATRAAVRAAVRDAAWAATRAAAWDATRAAAWDATRAAVRAAVRDAAGVAAGVAARDATRAAASTGLREMLTNHHAMPGKMIAD